MKYSDFVQQYTFEGTKEAMRTIRASTGLTQKAFSEKYDIPLRTLQDWEGGKREAPDYVLSLLAFAVRSEG